MTEPCDLSAVEARRLIGRRSLSPTALLQSCARRIEATNRFVNAIVTIDLDTAHKRAAAIEQALMRGEEIGVLAGLPIGVKDLQATAGLKTTSGSLLFKDHVPERDESSVANVRKRRWVDFGKDQYARIRRRRQHGQSRLRTYSQSFRRSEDVRGIFRRLRRGPGAGPGAIGDGDGLWRQYSNARGILRRGWFQALTRRRTQVIPQTPVYSESPVQWPARWRMLIFCCAPNSATRTPATIGVFRPS